jgi:hypothetical protein
MPLTPTEQLDYVLDALKLHEAEPMTVDMICLYLKTINIDIPENVLQQVINKLDKDGYTFQYNTSTGKVRDPDFKVFSLHKLTFEGYYFISQGKYKQQQADIKISRDAEYIRTLILTYGTALAGVGGIGLLVVEFVKLCRH